MLEWDETTGPPIAREVIRDLFITINYGTLWTTVLICTTRVIKVCTPFYQIKTSRISICSIIYLIHRTIVFVVLVICVSYAPVRDNPDAQRMVRKVKLSEGIILTGVTLIIVVGTTIALARALSKVTDTELAQASNNRSAIMTVIILSVLMFTCYLPTQILMTMKWNNLDLKVWEGSVGEGWVVVVGSITSVLLIPVNSALNPVVYFVRKEAMRSYLVEVICDCKQKFSLKFRGGTGAVRQRNCRRQAYFQRNDTKISISGS